MTPRQSDHCQREETLDGDEELLLLDRNRLNIAIDLLEGYDGLDGLKLYQEDT